MFHENRRSDHVQSNAEAVQRCENQYHNPNDPEILPEWRENDISRRNNINNKFVVKRHLT